MLRRLRVPAEWLAKGPDGFQAADEPDIVFRFGTLTPRASVLSDMELIELAMRRPPLAHPVYKHLDYCSPCCGRLRALYRLKGG